MASTWTTKDGRIIPIAQMTDDHLLNTIRMIEAKFQEALLDAFGAAASFNGEMAQMYAEQEAMSLVPPAVLDELIVEADRRHLRR